MSDWIKIEDAQPEIPKFHCCSDEPVIVKLECGLILPALAAWYRYEDNGDVGFCCGEYPEINPIRGIHLLHIPQGMEESDIILHCESPWSRANIATTVKWWKKMQ